MQIVNLAEEDLGKWGIDKNTIHRIMLMIEETEMMAISRGSNEKDMIE